MQASNKIIQNKVFKYSLDSMKILLLFGKVDLLVQQLQNVKDRQGQIIWQETIQVIESLQTFKFQTIPSIKAFKPSQKQSATMNWGTNQMEDVMHPKT